MKDENSNLNYIIGPNLIITKKPTMNCFITAWSASEFPNAQKQNHLGSQLQSR